MDDIRIPKMECDYTLIKILIFKTYLHCYNSQYKQCVYTYTKCVH